MNQFNAPPLRQRIAQRRLHSPACAGSVNRLVRPTQQNADAAACRLKAWLFIALGILACVAGCNREAEQTAIATVGGDPTRGRQMMAAYGCVSCHTVPGIHGANALIGPPLTSMGSRAYVGGSLQNTPQNIIRWIQNPPSINAKTAMPNLHVTDGDARDIATYLYTLR